MFGTIASLGHFGIPRNKDGKRARYCQHKVQILPFWRTKPEKTQMLEMFRTGKSEAYAILAHRDTKLERWTITNVLAK
jgi:hypothetical protein